MLRRETTLWFLFFVTCLSAGYLRGILPETRLSFFWNHPEEVKVLVYSDKLFPEFLVDDLEQRTHTKIQLDVSNSYNDFLARSVSQSGYSMFVLPRLWSESLSRQGLLLQLAGLKSFFQKILHPDFPSLKSQIFPWAWIPTLFVTKVNTNLKDISSIALIEEEDHLYQVLKKIPRPQPQVELRVQSLLEEADEISDNQLKEVNYFCREDYGLVKSPEAWPKSLFLFDVVIPRRTPRQTTSIALLKNLFSSDHLSLELGEQPFGVTTKTLDQTALFPFEKKPSALRNQAMKGLIMTQAIDIAERDHFLNSFTLKR
jgi:hypothetical protein